MFTITVLNKNEPFNEFLLISPTNATPNKSPILTILLMVTTFTVGILAGLWWMDTTGSLSPLVSTPTGLFDNAYHRIQNDYLDPSLNGQEKAFQRWRDHYRHQLETNDDAHIAIASMLASLGDSYSRFLPPVDMDEQTLQMDARLSGIGVQIVMRGDALTVVSTMDDSPADKAGLLPNDVITHVDKASIVGLPIQDAASRIRGPEGSQVQLTLQRRQKTLTREIERRTMPLKSVTTEETTDNRIGYLRLSTFLSENMMAEIDTALDELKSKQALILDLRGNYGGLLDNAIALSDRFLSNGTIVTIQSTHDGTLNKDNLDAQKQANDIAAKPLLVLVDSGSASASEITAAALKDNHRAQLVGDTTFGKGLVQKVITFADGSGMNLSVSRYLTPAGDNIHKKGITPDVLLPVNWMHTPEETDPQRAKAIEILQNQLDPA